MNDARFDRPTVGDATGDARPVDGSTADLSDQPGVERTRIWSRRHGRGRFVSSQLVHWVDEKGSVVRLISSGDPVASDDDT